MQGLKKNMMSEGAAAEFLGVSRRTIASWRKDDSVPLPYTHLGYRYLYKEEELRKFIENNTVNCNA